MSRQPTRDLYDALVDLEPKKKGEIPTYAYGLVKITYEIINGRARPTKPEPLQFDVYRDSTLDPG